MSIMATTFNALANHMTFLREQGVLKRIHGTPLPGGAYLAGILGNAATNALIQVRSWCSPASCSSASAGRRTGSSCCVFIVARRRLLRVARRRLLARDPELRRGPRLPNIVFLPMIFISGVFYDVDNAPAFLRDIAEALPLVHVIDGLSAAMVTGKGARRPRR